jgi:hypothetical protein
MRDLIILLVHLITIVFRLVRPGGLRSVVAESVLTKHQFLIVNRTRRRAPKSPRLGSADHRILLALDKADSPSAGGNRIKTVNRAAVASRSGPGKVSATVFAKVPSEA